MISEHCNPSLEKNPSYGNGKVPTRNALMCPSHTERTYYMEHIPNAHVDKSRLSGRRQHQQPRR